MISMKFLCLAVIGKKRWCILKRKQVAKEPPFQNIEEILKLHTHTAYKDFSPFPWKFKIVGKRGDRFHDGTC